MTEAPTPFQQTYQSLCKKLATTKNKLDKTNISLMKNPIEMEIKVLEGKIEFLEIGYNQRKEEAEDQKVIFQEDQPKPIHISVVAEDQGSQASWYFKDATVGQLSMINHEIDLLKREVLDRIGKAPKEWEIQETNEDP